MEIYVVFAALLFLVVVLYKSWVRPTIAFLFVILLFLILGILTPAEALHGFANEQLAIILFLLMVSGTLQKTGVIDKLFGKIFSQKDSPRLFISKMMLTVGAASSFLNNTPLVAMMLPYVNTWTKKKGLAPSHFLIPLSFASILGGCITLIGTSTNLIVNGLAMEQGYTSLGIFDFVWVGLPMMVVGALYLIFFSQRLLPDNGSILQEMNQKEFFVETIVGKESRLVGKTVEQAGLRGLEGLYLVEIVRENLRIKPVAPDELLMADDCLQFVGKTESIADITKPGLGLSLPKPSMIDKTETTDLIEVVVSQNSRLAGLKVQESDFRARYDAAILAIHRNGESMQGKIGDIVMRPGDVLLTLAGPDFFSRVENNPHFYQLSQSKQIHQIEPLKIWVLVLGLLAAIGLSVAGVASLFLSLLVLLFVIVVMGIAKPSEIRNSIDFNLALIIALGLALGTAMINTGAAALVADSLVSATKGASPLVLMIVLFALNNLLAAFMTSKASVAITLPIALSTAGSMGLDPKPFILLIAFSGAANFITPIGYQTNLMVYGPGGYNFKDFMRIGLPLTLIYLAVTVVILNRFL